MSATDSGALTPCVTFDSLPIEQRFYVKDWESMVTRKKMPERRRRILDFLQEFYFENGIPPTVRDIQQACSISSTSVVDYNLKQLEEAGYLNRRKEVARGIKLLDRDGEPVSSAPRVQIVGSIAAGAAVARVLVRGRRRQRGIRHHRDFSRPAAPPRQALWPSPSGALPWWTP